MENYEQQARLFKALMHPVRLAILEILQAGEECVCHMEAALGLRQAYISQQLMVLREAGLVQDRRDGWNIFYRVIRPEVFDILQAAHQLTGDGDKEPQARHEVEAVAANCSCPRCSRVAEHS